MRLRLRPYSDYKESGTPWFGLIPSHWESVRLGSLLQERGETNEDGQVKQVLSVLRDIGVIPYEEKGNIGNKRSEDIGRYKLVRHGDIVINCMNVIIGSVGLSRYTGCLSPVYYVLKTRSNNDNSQYFEKVFKVKPFQLSLVRLGNGILAHRMRIPMELLKCELVPKPPSEEQAIIVRFIDVYDLRVNSLIRNKQRLIKLLNEQKQAIIHRTVTRGLDPNVRLKPSGVDWLGDVPEHWDVWQIGHFAKVGNGSTPSRSNSSYWTTDGFPWLNSASVNQRLIIDSNQFVTSLALKECHLPRVAPGSILVAITGQGKTRGTSAVLGIEATINQHIAYITPKKKIVSPAYLQLALVGAYNQLRTISDDSGSTKGALTCEDLKHFKVGLPPFEEQRQIVLAINSETYGVDAILNRAQREIELLREYQTRLVADVVTGKLDVRGVELSATGAEETEAFDEDDNIEAPEDANAIEELA